MGRKRRHQDPELFYLLTNRTLNGMFLLLPDEEANRIILSCLAKYVDEYDVQLVCVTFMFNHFHLVARFPERNMNKFMRDLQREIADRINDHRNDRDGTVFPVRYDDKPLVDAAALVDAISYVVNNPVRHKLVSSPTIWPGIATDTRHLSGEVQLRGQWLDADLWYNLSRRKAEHDRCEAFIEIAIDFHLPDCLPGEDCDEKLTLLRAKIHEDRQYFLAGKSRTRELSTPRELMRSHWSETRPRPSTRSRKFAPRRRCIAGAVHRFANYHAFLRDIEAKYEAAANKWRAGEPAEFPIGTIPPGRSKCVSEVKPLPSPTSVAASG